MSPHVFIEILDENTTVEDGVLGNVVATRLDSKHAFDTVHQEI